MTVKTTYIDYMSEIVDWRKRILNAIDDVWWGKAHRKAMVDIVSHIPEQDRISITKQEYDRIMERLIKNKWDYFVLWSAEVFVCNFWDEYFLAADTTSLVNAST